MDAKKRDILNSKRSTGPSSSLASRKTASASASVNLSGGASKDPVEQDPEVEVDIYYSQYLQAKLMEKIMNENKTLVEKTINDQFSKVLDPKTGLQNPKVASIMKRTEELQQLAVEYVKLTEVKDQLDRLENQI